MKTKFRPAVVFVLTLTAQAAIAQTLVVVNTKYGTLAGTGNEIHVWKGIPYAQPPVGNLRWKEPQPPAAWQGVRPAVDFGPMCPQGNPDQLKPDMSEDCLNLNVWSGAKEGEKRPVFVWIHGGGFGGGSGRIDGEPLARLGLVVVGINYRLGMLGFMAHPELTSESPHKASGNYGLMDQIAALKWVQQNIMAFGGDPERVTIGGSSAGGTSIGYLIASPLAKGLFRGAWLDSASRLFLPDPGLSETLHGLTPMEQVGLRVGPHIQELRALGTAEIMKRGAQAADELYGEGGTGVIGLKPESHVHIPTVHDHPWWAFTDGYVMPEELETMFRKGKFNRVSCLIGTCRDEGLNFTLRMPDLTEAGYEAYLHKYYAPIGLKMLEIYPGTTPEEIRASITRTITDAMFLYGSIRVADFESAAHQTVFVERFTHVSPGAPGVMHGADAVYFRGDVRDGVVSGAVKYGAADEKLSAEMMKHLVSFVTRFNTNYGQTTFLWPMWKPKQSMYLEIGDGMKVQHFHDQKIINLYREDLRQ